VLVALDGADGAQILGRQVLDQPFGQHRRPVVVAVTAALDDRAGQHVDDLAEPDRRVAELLGDDAQRGAGCLADAEREVAGGAAHGHDQVPARGGARVDHQVLDQLRADVAGGLEAEGRDAVGQVEVVVDGLGHVHHAQPAAGLLGQRHRRKGRVVAANGQQLVDPQLFERGDRRLHVLRLPGWVGA
jgi:hypothetical protein